MIFLQSHILLHNQVMNIKKIDTQDLLNCLSSSVIKLYLRILTCSVYNELINWKEEKTFSPSFGLKNCPTPMDAAGGGLPETV